MTFKKGDKKNVEDKMSSSSEDWSENTSANMATSLKRINVKKTPTQSQPQTTQIDTTRKSTRARQSTLAKMLGSPVPINNIDRTKTIQHSVARKTNQNHAKETEQTQQHHKFQ